MESSRTRRPRRGFTLVELLVVIGIIALLISILLPSLSKARKSANTVKCLAQHKQLMSAVLIYANSWKGALPWSNWDARNAANAPYPGWAYDPKNMISGAGFTPDDLKNSVLWETLGTVKAWRCPDDSTTAAAADIQTLTTYIMNGCLTGMTSWTPTLNPTNLYKITAFKADTAAFWEIGSASSIPSGARNDATNGPQEGITVRHAKGTTISFLDGHAEVWPLDRYITELNRTGGADGSPLWRNPRATNGGYTKGTSTVYVPGPQGSGANFIYSE